MKKLFLTLAIALVVAVSVVSGASAQPSPGVAFDPWGSHCIGCKVKIHNANTGAVGETVTDGNGQYSFGGLVLSNQYQTWIDTCKVHSRLVGAASALFYGSASSFPTVYSNNGGAC